MYSEELPRVSGGWGHPWLTRAGPTEDTWGGSYQLAPVGVGEEGAERGGRSHKDGTGKTKCELGVSIGNSAFTFLLHFYFKHRKRERKQIEKKNVQEKREKEIKLLLFLFWQHVPFSFLSLLLVPQPQMLHQLSPHPQSPFLWGRVGARGREGDSHREGKHAGQRPRETRGEGTTGRQKDHAFRALVRGASGREWGDTLVPSRPVRCPPARTRGPGKEAQFLPGPGCPELREQTELLPVCAGPTWEQLGPPNPHHPERANTERG